MPGSVFAAELPEQPESAMPPASRAAINSSFVASNLRLWRSNGSSSIAQATSAAGKELRFMAADGCEGVVLTVSVAGPPPMANEGFTKQAASVKVEGKAQESAKAGDRK